MPLKLNLPRNKTSWPSFNENKNADAQVHVIGKRGGQPLVHDPIGRRPSNGIGEQKQFGKVFGQQPDQVPLGRTQRFANAHLFGALHNRQRSQAEQPQAGDDDGKQGRITDDLTPAFFAFILPMQVASNNIRVATTIAFIACFSLIAEPLVLAQMLQEGSHFAFHLALNQIQFILQRDESGLV